MRVQCDKCEYKSTQADTSDALNDMKIHYATHEGAKPKGSKKPKVTKQAD